MIIRVRPGWNRPDRRDARARIGQCQAGFQPLTGRVGRYRAQTQGALDLFHQHKRRFRAFRGGVSLFGAGRSGLQPVAG